MTDYSVYFLDHLARIEFGADMQCCDDAAAFQFATSLLPESGQVEVWSGVRRLGRIYSRHELLDKIQHSVGLVSPLISEK
jgi:hypothetical protein